MRESAVRNSPLPPSVEKAYHQKCIDLKRRLNEIEESNDAARLRKHRLDRAITKMRIERALLLDQLTKAQHYNRDESDNSTTPPPTPLDRLSRPKRSYNRRSSPGLEDYNGGASSPHRLGDFRRSQEYGVGHPLMPLAPSRGPDAATAALARPLPHGGFPPITFPPNLPPETELPLIQTLPVGTSVILARPGVHKPGPWTIRDLNPRHIEQPMFEQLSLQQQEVWMSELQYLPYDLKGHPVLMKFDPKLEKYYHVHIGDPEWKNPVVENVRTDGSDSIRRREESKRSMPGSLSEGTGRGARSSSGPLRKGRGGGTAGDGVSKRGKRKSAVDEAELEGKEHGKDVEAQDERSASGPEVGTKDSSSAGAGGFTAVNR